jgi:hypothetical protein
VFAVERHFGIHEIIRVALGRGAVESQQGGGIAHRQRAQEHEVEEAKSGEVHADAEGQHQDRHGREGGRLAQHARGVAEVLKKAGDPGPAPGIARLFAEEERVAEALARSFGAGPLAGPGAGGHFAMKFHVAGQLPVEAAAVQQITDTAK